MRMGMIHAKVLAIVLAVASSHRATGGQQLPTDKAEAPSSWAVATPHERPLHLASYMAQDKKSNGAQSKESEKTVVRTETRTVEENGYKEVSSFFNIREANANIDKCEWEFELTTEWETGGEGDDDFFFGPSLKYGITDDLFIELEVIPIQLGDGGDHGAGDIELVLFQQLLHESGSTPALAAWLEGRFPTGDGSSGVDGALHMAVTKTIAPKWRVHLEGFVETANGAPGGEDEDERRAFQWGIGPGIDYQFNEKTIGVLNYINSASEEYGQSNSNILELGLAHELAPNQHLKAAFDINLDHHDDEPNFGAKIQWSIEW